ncbi:MAG: hypothetical protein DME76_01945 [Verrucomicrobia bacterium]|nr:MAG: hypothetical protein DME76_01945 [Verrucomicrobiota bacterium]
MANLTGRARFPVRHSDELVPWRACSFADQAGCLCYASRFERAAYLACQYVAKGQLRIEIRILIFEQAA